MLIWTPKYIAGSHSHFTLSGNFKIKMITSIELNRYIIIYRALRSPAQFACKIKQKLSTASLLDCCGAAKRNVWRNYSSHFFRSQKINMKFKSRRTRERYSTCSTGRGSTNTDTNGAKWPADTLPDTLLRNTVKLPKFSAFSLQIVRVGF